MSAVFLLAVDKDNSKKKKKKEEEEERRLHLHLGKSLSNCHKNISFRHKDEER